MEEQKNNRMVLKDIIETLQKEGLIFGFDIELVFQRKISLDFLSQMVVRRFYDNFEVVEKNKEKNNPKIPDENEIDKIESLALYYCYYSL